MPSAIDSSSEFQVESDGKRCWDFFTSLQSIGECIPGCESVTPLGDGTALFRVKVSVGYISKSYELKTKFKEIVPNTRISFVGEGKDAEVMGTVLVKPGSHPGSTALVCTLQIRPLSTVSRAAITMFGGDFVKKQADAFTSCIKAKLEATVH